MLIRLDKVDGRSFEVDGDRKLPAMVGVVFRRCRVLELSELVESIEYRISEAERLDLLQTAIVAKARREGQDVHLLVEVSCTAEQGEVPVGAGLGLRNREKLRPREGKWRASGGERPVRRMMNSIRHVVAASLLAKRKAQEMSAKPCLSGWDGRSGHLDGTSGCENQVKQSE